VLKRPPHPLQTVELQKRASRYLRMGAELSIKMAEELYMVRVHECLVAHQPPTSNITLCKALALNNGVWCVQEGYLSYPRTETDQFPEGFDTRSLIEMQTPHHLWGEYAGRLLNGDIYQCAPNFAIHENVVRCFDSTHSTAWAMGAQTPSRWRPRRSCPSSYPSRQGRHCAGIMHRPHELGFLPIRASAGT
jgi:hypothetical protein